jgi:hypothetical protein
MMSSGDKLLFLGHRYFHRRWSAYLNRDLISPQDFSSAETEQLTGRQPIGQSMQKAETTPHVHGEFPCRQ